MLTRAGGFGWGFPDPPRAARRPGASTNASTSEACRRRPNRVCGRWAITTCVAPRNPSTVLFAYNTVVVDGPNSGGIDVFYSAQYTAPVRITISHYELRISGRGRYEMAVTAPSVSVRSTPREPRASPLRELHAGDGRDGDLPGNVREVALAIAARVATTVPAEARRPSEPRCRARPRGSARRGTAGRDALGRGLAGGQPRGA